MNEPVIPKYEWGQRVQAGIDLYNDGSFPDQAPDALLARSGDVGEIVQVGTLVETNIPVYLVEFSGNRVVGCLEEEIIPLRGPAAATKQEGSDHT
jgi:nitrogen fixation protein NifZ